MSGKLSRMQPPSERGRSDFEGSRSSIFLHIGNSLEPPPATAGSARKYVEFCKNSIHSQKQMILFTLPFLVFLFLFQGALYAENKPSELDLYTLSTANHFAVLFDQHHMGYAIGRSLFADMRRHNYLFSSRNGS